jgi:ABC-type transport system substrate-binding protein
VRRRADPVLSKGRFDRTPLRYDPVKQYVAYDPKKAADLLKAAGVSPNKEYEFMVPVEAQTWVDSGRLIAEDLAKVWMKTRVNPVVRNIYLQRAGPKPGDFDISMSVLLDYRHATGNSGSFWNSNALNDPEIDAMVDRIFETVDNQQRQKLSQDFELTLAKKYSNFEPVLSTLTRYAWYAYLKGYDPDFHPKNGLPAKRWIDK